MIALAAALDNFDERSTLFGLRCEDPSLTQQHFRDESDINTIVDRFMRTGVLPDPVSMPQYIDAEGVYDFKEAMNFVRSSEEAFMRLDAKIRSRFHNSPREFVEFFGDPANRSEAERLGLVNPSPVKQEPAPVAPVVAASAA